MIRIKLSNPPPDWPWFRQTPGRTGIWGNCQFFISPEIKECDYWLVYEGLANRETVRCPREHVIFVTGEPPSIRTYDPSFLGQFSTVFTCRPDIVHPGKVVSQPALPWWVGLKFVHTEVWSHKFDPEFSLDYDFLKRTGIPKKERLMSIVTSDKTRTKGHERRLAFARWIKKEFEGEVDVFISGERILEDKWDAIAPYKYHIAIENSAYDNYFTEKLTDPFLGMSYPLYYGCPNLADYFPKDAFAFIDINNQDAAERLIRQVIKEERFEKHATALMEAKRLVLDKFNLFAMFSEFCEGQSSKGEMTKITLEPERKFMRWKGLRSRLSRFV
jgi:hypothetical protein